MGSRKGSTPGPPAWPALPGPRRVTSRRPQAAPGPGAAEAAMIKSGGAKGKARITFTVDPQAGAQTAAVCGEWNDLSAGADVMHRDAEGGLSVTVGLEAGRAYRFRYLLDGQRWDNDWSADAYQAQRLRRRRLRGGPGRRPRRSSQLRRRRQRRRKRRRRAGEEGSAGADRQEGRRGRGETVEEEGEIARARRCRRPTPRPAAWISGIRAQPAPLPRAGSRVKRWETLRPRSRTPRGFPARGLAVPACRKG